MSLERYGSRVGETGGPHDDLHEELLERARVRRPLARLLAEAGVASGDQLRLATVEGMTTGERLGEVVLRRGWIDEGGLARLLARQWDLRFVDESAAVVDERVAGLLDARAAAELGACPIGLDEEEVPLVALAEPAEERFAAVRSVLDREVRFAVVGRSTLVELLEQLESARAAALSRPSTAEGDEEQRRLDEQVGAVLGSLETAAAAVAGLRDEVALVAAGREQAQRELEHCRHELAALTEARANDVATIERLRGDLAEQRNLAAHVRSSLAEITDALAER
jgi:chromosome segregation ATPase